MRSLEENKEFYRQYIEEVFNRRNLGALAQYVAEDYVLHDAPGHLPNGPKAIEGVVQMFEGAFSDFHVSKYVNFCGDSFRSYFWNSCDG
jgi:ketosteroid isomerase-like protein